MKHIKIYIMMLLALGFTACNEDFNQGVADPQSNPQEDPQIVEGFAISKDVDFNSPIVLGELEETAMLAAVKATATPEMAEGSSVTFRLFLSDTEDFAEAVLLETTSADNAATATISALNEATIELFGGLPEARTMHLRAYIFILNGTSSVRIADPVDLETITVTPILRIATTLYVPGGYQGWDPATAATLYTQKLNLIYDGYVNLPDDELEFKFIDAPAWGEGNEYGTDPDDDPGNLVQNGGNNISVSEGGFYRLTANLSALPYSYSATKTEWAIVGSATAAGWIEANAIPMTLNPANSEWTITATLTDGEMKFLANNSWDINLGGDVNNLTYGSPDNIPITAGRYLITLKLGDPTAYTATIVAE